MNIPVLCMVGLLVATPYGQNHLNIELQGYEVKEIASDRSLVDFTADIKAKRIAVIGPTVRLINMNLCRYMPEDVARFNARNVAAKKNGK